MRLSTTIGLIIASVGLCAGDAALAQCGVLIREDFRLGPRPSGDRGRERDVFVHDNLGGFWSQVPGTAQVRWIVGENPSWNFAASSVDPLEWPEDPAFPEYNGTAFGTHSAAAVIPAAAPAGAYSLSIDAVPIYGLDDGILFGFTRSPATSNNFAAWGEIWVRYSGKGDWLLMARGHGVVASGTGPTGNAITGFTPITLAYDPAGRRASVLIFSREVGSAILDFDPAFSYAGIEADAPFTDWQVVNNFTMREGPLSLLTAEPADAQAAAGSTVVLSAAAIPATRRFMWMKDGLPIADGAGPLGIVSGSETGELRIENATAAAGGGYDCTVISPCGSWTSRAAAVTITGAACPADFNGDGFVDFFDFDGFVAAFSDGGAAADFNADGFVDFFDFDAFVVAFEAGC